MSYRVRHLSTNDRARAKQESRAQDLERLQKGEISACDLARENNFFSALDLTKFEIVEIGGKPLIR